MSNDIRDITIIGGGPTGLFGAFFAGLRGVSCRVIDSLPELGGQLMALYPEKYIFDVGGIPKILAKDLARDMETQAMQFGPDIVLEEEVHTVEKRDDHFVLDCRGGEYYSRTILIAGGKGAFEPRHLTCPGYEKFAGKEIRYSVKDPEVYRDKKVLLVGGGDSAFDWALGLKDIAAELTMVHRRDGFRAHATTIAQVQAACEAGEMRLKTFYEVREIRGEGTLQEATIFDNRTDEDEELEVDAILCFLGFKPDLGPIKSWGLELEKNCIKVSQIMETNIPGIYGAGDIVTYPGKIELIATGFSEATIAVNQAVHFINPKARINPGHSTNLAIFKDK